MSLKNISISTTSLISIIYLLNPTAGVFELLPDNIPFIGNIDETLASYVLFSAIQYFRGKNIGLFKTGEKELK